LAHPMCYCGVGVETLILHANVHGDNVTLVQHSATRRNAVYNFVVDRRTDASGKAVKTLEGGQSSRMTANEFFCNQIQVQRCYARLDRSAQQFVSGGKNCPAARHNCNLALTLELNQSSTPPMPVE